MRAAAIALSLACCLASFGCRDSEESRVVDALSALRSAYLAKEYQAVCSAMTLNTQREVGRIAHNVPTTCARDLRARMPAGVISPRDLIDPDIKRIDVEGNVAAVRAVIGKAAPVTLHFRREDDTWKLSRLFSTGAVDKLPSSQPTPHARPPSVAVTRRSPDGHRAMPCPALRVLDIYYVRGGCAFHARSRMTVKLFNAFGDRFFARCSLGFLINVDHDGEIAISYASVLGDNHPDSTTCGDLLVCLDPSGGGNPPWRGRIGRDPNGQLSVEVRDVCFDLCLGRFAGNLSLPLDVKAGRLRLRGRLATLGRSGLTISGGWDLAPESPFSHSRLNVAVMS